MPETIAPEVVSDYGSYDYRELWKDRRAVSAVESELLRGMMAGQDLRRVVELGTGFGRLSPMIAGAAEEYVGVDFDPGHLRQAGGAARRARPGRSPPRLVLANLYHLPFQSASFTAEFLIRVFHHLSRPVEVLTGLRGRLAEGGRVFLTYNPRPSLGTLTNDVWRAITRPPGEPFISLTFSRRAPVVLPASPFPTFVDTVAAFRGEAVESGLVIEDERGYGLEEYTRRLPEGLFVALGSAVRPSSLHSTRLARLRVREGARQPLRPIETIFACPRCGVQLEGIDLERPSPVGCSGCAWSSAVTEGLNDLRYVPAESTVHSLPDPPERAAEPRLAS
jgi:SAM-dependent methyltransferase